MGFQLGRGIVLVFEGALEGAEVRLRPTPIAVTLQLQGDVSFKEATDLLVEYVTSWNFEGIDGQPLKLAHDDIMANMEVAVLEKVMHEWYKAARGVTTPLESPSKDGEKQSTVEEASTRLNDSLEMIPQTPLYPQAN
jgi:hypothetical protein